MLTPIAVSTKRTNDVNGREIVNTEIHFYDSKMIIESE